MKNILVIGSEGQIGWELQRTLMALGKVHSHDRPTLDICDEAAVTAAFQEIQPAVVVNAAAYTAVDAAENDQAPAWRLNADAPALLAKLSAKHGSLLVHYSTDYVFDGKASKPYLEETPTCPLSVYGASKLAGEDAIRTSGAHHLILRTSWIYGCRGKNFLLTMLKLAQQRSQFSVVADQIGAPTWSRLVAQTTAHLIDKTLHSATPQQLWGTYNLTCSGQTSWYEFAESIFNTYQQILPLYGLEAPSMPTVTPITTEQYPTAAARPAYSVLSHDKISERFGIKMADWRQALELCFHELISAQTTRN
jgi:dTDP-4-dehydrorhamnose reductase